MIVFSLFSFFFYLILNSFFFFPLFLLLFFVFCFSSFNFNFISTTLFSAFVFDEASIFMLYITFFVLFISYFFSFAPNSFSTVVSLFFILLFSVFVFVINNYFFIYLFYEASLLPILFIIINWGSYPERSISAFMLLIYTAVCSFPLLFVLFSLFSSSNTFFIFPIAQGSASLPLLYSFIIFIGFSVNLPIYGLHFWLPMAHVEAPTFGSIILAGVLLNLGGIGLFRFSSLVSFSSLVDVLCSYFFTFLFFATVICCFQSDFKRIVAYSSVSHIIAIPILYVCNSIVSINALFMLIFFHGLSSPILFILVGILYSIFSSRQLLSMRGLILLSPLISFITLIAFFFTMSAPPFPSFIAEVYFLLSSYSLSSYFGLFILVFTFFSLIYNIIWLSMINFSSPFNFSSDNTLSFSAFISLSISFLVCFIFLVLVCFF